MSVSPSFCLINLETALDQLLKHVKEELREEVLEGQKKFKGELLDAQKKFKEELREVLEGQKKFDDRLLEQSRNVAVPPLSSASQHPADGVDNLIQDLVQKGIQHRIFCPQ